MQLAIIPPINYLEEFSTSYHLVLAQLYRESSVYRAFYRERQQMGEFIILDNGAAEQGASIDAKELFYLALELKPNVLVCPDVLRDTDKTIEATNRFLDAYAGSLLRALKIQLMAVPQGATKEDWYRAFVWFNADPAISWLGISKYAPTERLGLLRMIKTKKKIHLLGMANDTKVIKEEKRFKSVMSTDTAVPVKLGMQLRGLGEYEKRVKIEDKEYFGYKGLTMEAVAQVKENVKAYKELCR